MKLLTQIFIFITAIFHFLFFKLESIDFMKPEVIERFGLTQQSAKHVESWAFNQGFYNLFFAMGLIYSIFLLRSKNEKYGKTLANFILLSIIGASIVLFLSVPGKLTAALIQGVPALFGIFCLHFRKLNMITVG